MVGECFQAHTNICLLLAFLDSPGLPKMVVELCRKKLVLLAPSHCPPPIITLDHKIWSCLPPDLIDRIFACLPFISFLRLRLVCRRWNSLASSFAFLRLYSHTMPSPSCLMLFAEEALCDNKRNQGIFSGHGRTKHSLSCIRIIRKRYSTSVVNNPSCRPSCGTIKWGVSLDFLPNPHRIKILSTAAGLVLCSNGAHFSFVFNPLTKTWRPLPPIARRICPLLTAIVAETCMGGGYKVIFAGFKGSDTESTEAYLYDSISRRWSKTGSLTRKIDRYPRFFIGKATQCNGILYWVAPEFDGTLITFHLEDETWNTMETGWTEGVRGAQWPQLIEYKGCLLMIGVVGKKVIVWQLESEKACWEEIGRVQDRISKTLCNCLWGLECARLEDSIYVSAYNKPGILIYNLSTTKSEWISCQNEAQPFSFEPRLDALV